MKTNPIARGILRIRAIVLCVAIVGLVVAEVGLGQSLAARYAQYTPAYTQTPQAPSLSIDDFMAAAPVVR